MADVRDLALQLPELLATLPKDVGRIIRIELCELGVMTVETWQPFPGYDRFGYEMGTRTVWMPDGQDCLTEYESFRETREKRRVFQ